MNTISSSLFDHVRIVRSQPKSQ